MSMKGNKDEPIIAGEERKQAAPANQNTPTPKTSAAAAGNETTGNATTASKEPILGLESNNNQNQNKVPLKTID